jgi:hypothetical protein
VESSDISDAAHIRGEMIDRTYALNRFPAVVRIAQIE